MQLADFIRAEIEPILMNWEAFAKTIFHASNMDKTGLRDHAREMLLAIADAMEARQDESERAAKSRGCGPEDEEESWAEIHGSDRQSSGFSVIETVSEFRALRASVVSLWTKSRPTFTGQELDDLTRFNEAIDQAVAESLEHYATLKEMDTRLFGAILVASPDPIYVLDIEGRFIYANKATATLFALQPEVIIGKNKGELGFPFASDFYNNLKSVTTDQTICRGNLVHTFASGQGDRFEYLLAPVLDEQQKTEAIVCIFRDVTERALAEEKIWHNAHHDPLTGLPNRRLFQDRLDQEIKHANRNSLPLALLFLDLDGFKEVNDLLGHEAGDVVLCEVAERLTHCIREDDTVARLGGDEFTVILAAAKWRKDVDHVAQSIISALAMPFETTQQRVYISASIGISFYPHDASATASLLQAADKAMYNAKASGSNRICFYDSSDNTNGYAH